MLYCFYTGGNRIKDLSLYATKKFFYYYPLQLTPPKKKKYKKNNLFIALYGTIILLFKFLTFTLIYEALNIQKLHFKPHYQPHI